MISSKNVGLVWLVMLLLILCDGSHEASARKWRPPKPEVAATEYALIFDQRSPAELVIVWWFPPEGFPESQETELARKVLREYLLVGVAHIDVSEIGTSSFRPISNLQIKTADGMMLQPLAETDVPPVAASIAAGIRNMSVQMVGPLGESIRWLTFKNKGIDSCKGGRFWVVYAGERYEYETPIPGCK